VLECKFFEEINLNVIPEDSGTPFHYGRNFHNNKILVMKIPLAALATSGRFLFCYNYVNSG
jgi:hypothetical protein